MARINLDTQAPAVAIESEGGNFAPIPEGEYLVNIYDVQDSKYGENGVNAGRPSLRVQLAVADGQSARNRRLFETIPMFDTWAKKPGKDKGADAFSFFDFWGAVLGDGSKAFRAAYNEAVEAGNDPFELLFDNAELLGKQVVVQVVHEQSDYAYKQAVAKNGGAGTLNPADFLQERIKAWKPASESTVGSAPELPTSSTSTFTL